MKPRVAVLGCGYWGSNHIRTLKALGVLHAVADLNAARAEGFATEQDCLAIPPDELARHDEIDAIVMALPPQFHAEAAIAATENGKDVLVEKPIALTVPDAEKAVETARRNGGRVERTRAQISMPSSPISSSAHVAEPVDVAQGDAARGERLAGADDDATAIGVERTTKSGSPTAMPSRRWPIV
jgi:3-hydroxyisobutyrate dehydrogenase-like beta-hydroxyacid dehydrogenase